MGGTNLLIAYSFFFVFALVFSLIINGLLLRFSKNLGIRNHQEILVRWSSTSKPSLGGLSFFFIFLLSFLWLPFFAQSPFSFYNLQAIGVMAAIFIGFLTGLFDDAYNTHPWKKFAGQLLSGLVLIVCGVYIQFFNLELLNYLVTLFWVVGIMNSINMLDNMDGITSVSSLGILGSMLGIMAVSGHLTNPFGLLIIAIMGSLAGFLAYNWHPSKMYMGDTGSQFLGITLASFGIIFLWNAGVKAAEMPPLTRALLVATAFALPISDTTTVCIKRILKGSSPFVGGKDHTTHHLSYLGLSDRWVAVVFAVLSIVSAGLTVRIFYAPPVELIDFIGFGVYPGLLFLVLFLIALRPPAPKVEGK